jgi:hypothetical protein
MFFHRLERLGQRVTEFIERINDFCLAAREKLKKVTGEYLIFRHNAKVAKVWKSFSFFMSYCTTFAYKYFD